MKRFLLLATLATSSMVAVAHVSSVAPVKPQEAPTSQRYNSSEFVPLSEKPGTLKSLESVQSAGWTAMYATETHSSNHFLWSAISNSMRDVLKYDAATNALVLIRNKMVTPIDPNAFVTQLGLMVSPDLGATWTFVGLEPQEPGFFGRPNFVFKNDGEDMTAWPYAIYGIQWSATGLNGEFTYKFNVPGDRIVYSQKVQDPAPNYTYGFRDMDFVEANNWVVSAAYSNVVTGSNAPFGAYDYQNYRMDDGEFNPYGQPEAWGFTKWRDDPNGGGGNYNAHPIVSSDNAGNVYTAFLNVEANDANFNRTVFVSKSTDGGTSWSATFEKLPPQTILDALAPLNKGHYRKPGQESYRDGEFIVTGENQYSYFFRVQAWEVFANGDSIRNPNWYLMEGRFNAGTWSANVITEIPMQSFQKNATDQPDYDAFFYYEIITDPFGVKDSATVYVEPNLAAEGSEVDAAVTADGQHMVIKWVAMDTNKVTIFPDSIKAVAGTTSGTTTTYEDIGYVSGIIGTEIYMSYRPLSGGAWSTPVNVSGDNAQNWRTMMPDVVPSITKVPIVQVTNPRTGTVVSKMPSQIGEVVMGSGLVESRLADATKNATTSVNEELQYNFSFGAISPNPTSAGATVNFVLDAPGFVSVDVVDVVGNVVSKVASSNMEAGSKSVSVNTTPLSSGTYYVALTVDGKRLMKPMAVIK